MELFNDEKVRTIFHVLQCPLHKDSRTFPHVYDVYMAALRDMNANAELGGKVRKETNEKGSERKSNRDKDTHREREKETMKYKYRISLMIKTVPNFMILCAHVHIFITSKYSVASSCSYARNVLLFKSISILWSCTDCTTHTHLNCIHYLMI